MSVFKAAVLGSPVTHSLSPVLHQAGYEALGLDDWEYDRIECPAGELAAIVGGAATEYRGFSVTMPGKSEALEFADEVTERAELIGSANTLVRTDGGWLADCTDVDGAYAALTSLTELPATPRAVILGAGGTARPVIAALVELEAAEITVATRNPTAVPAIECGHRLGTLVQDIRLADPELEARMAEADVVINTIPADGVGSLVARVAGVKRLVDVLYHPWPTPLGAAVAESGGEVVGGDVMLLGQALGQFEQFTGCPAPEAEMSAALTAALQP